MLSGSLSDHKKGKAPRHLTVEGPCPLHGSRASPRCRTVGVSVQPVTPSGTHL